MSFLAASVMFLAAEGVLLRARKGETMGVLLNWRFVVSGEAEG